MKTRKSHAPNTPQELKEIAKEVSHCRFELLTDLFSDDEVKDEEQYEEIREDCRRNRQTSMG